MRTLYTTQGPEDSLKYRNSSRNNDIMIPAVLRYFQRLDFKHSLETSVGEAVTLRAMNNFKRKWERTIWVGFLTLPLICLLFMNTFSWHGFLMDSPQDTYLVVKTQGEREFQIPAWNGRAQLFSACKKLWGLAKGMWHYAGGAPTLFLPRKVMRIQRGRTAAPGLWKKIPHPHPCQLLQLSWAFLSFPLSAHLWAHSV